MQEKKNIAVFAAGQDGVEQKYRDVAYKTGELIAQSGFNLVNGSGFGLMEETARGARDAGGYIIAVGLQGLEEKNEYIDKYYERIGIHSRQSTLITLSDAFIAVPGGLGTLYEITEIIELKKLGEEEPEPVIVINAFGFYNGLKLQMDEMRKNEYIKDAYSKYVVFVETPDEAIDMIKSFYNDTEAVDSMSPMTPPSS